MRNFRLFELSYVALYVILIIYSDKVTPVVTSMIGSIPSLFVGVVLVLLSLVFLMDLFSFTANWVRRNIKG